MLIGKLWASLGMDMTDFENKIKLAEYKLKNMSNQMTKTGRNLTMFVTLPLVGAAGAAFKFASDLDEALNKVDVAFKDNAQIVKDWSKTTLQSFGLAQGTSLDMVALFGDMATSMGFTTKQAADMSMSLVGLAADMASFKNINVEQASTALKAIFTGETESLKSLGIVMTEANINSYALQNGMEAMSNSMTQAEKVQLRYNFVMDATKNSQGDFARTNKGAANQMRIFVQSLKETGAAFGRILLPVITPVIQKINAALKSFANLTEEQKRWIIGIGAAVAAIGPLLWVFGKLLTVVPLLVTGIKAVSVALSFLSANPVVAIAAGLLAIGTAIYAYATRASEAEKIQKKLNETVKDAVQPLIKEKTEITSLAQLAMQYNEGSEDRVRILKRLNEKYPAFLKNLDIEKTTNKDLAGFITKVNEAYTEKIKVAALEAKQGKAMEEAVQLEGERLDLLQEQALWMDKYNKLRTGQTWGLFAKEDLPEVERKLNDISQSLKENASESALWMAEVQKWGKAYTSAAKSFDDAFGDDPFGGGKEKGEEFAKALSEINEQYKLQVSLARTLYDTKEAEMEKAKALFELYRKFYSEGGYTKDAVKKLKALNAEVEKLSLEMKNLPMGQTGKEGMLAEIEPAVNKAVSDLLKLREAVNKAVSDLLKLREAVKSIDESLMDDNAKMEAQYVENVRIIQEAIKRGILTQSEGNVMINKLLDQMIDKNKTIAEDTDTMGKFVKSTWESIGNTIANVMSDVALSLGKALVGAEGSWKESISNILQSLTQLISGLFAAAAAAMISGQMVYSGGMLWGLAAATIGLGALTALWSKNVANLEGMADGGRVIRGGAFLVGESGPEIVNMTPGTHVTPNYALGGGFIAETRIKGNDLLVVVKRAEAQSKRR